MTDAERAELQRLTDAVAYLAAQIERLDREVHTLRGQPAPAAKGWSRAMGT
jgi:outer membrane murein-binding lipoprotein Lpp